MAPIQAGLKGNKDPTSWADQMENEDDESLLLPPKTEVIEGDTKKVTEYEINADGEKIKYIRYYKIQKIKVPKSIAVRKSWKKFGKASNDGAGPNPSNTVIQDDILMDFKVGDDTRSGDDNVTKKLGKNFVKCRFCEMDHWSNSCPYKDKLALKTTDKEAALAAAGTVGGGSACADKGGVDKNKYVPPSMRGGADAGKQTGVSMNTRSKDEANTIRVTNLPEDIQDSDIRELFNPFGRISRIFLARDKYTGQSKGFAFVSFERREDAAVAVRTVNGHGYANLILSVEWAKPSGN